MKKSIFKRFAAIAACASVCVANMATVSAYADYSADRSDFNLEIVSSAAPDSVVEYGRKTFERIKADDLEYLDITYNSLSDVKLCQPFQTFDDNDTDCYDIYFFPVINNKGVEAVLTVLQNTESGELTYQFGKDDMTSALNEISAENDSPVEIHENDDCIYAVTDESVDVLYVFKGKTVNVIGTTENCGVTSSDDNDTRFNTVDISSESAYSERITPTRSTVGKKRPVVYVDNYVYNGSGTCWASCVGALSTYYNNPSTGGSATDGSNVRYAAVAVYGNNGTLTNSKSAIESYTSASMVISSSSLTWSNLKSEILANEPFFSGWTSSSGNHAMVVSGYTYDSNNPSDTSAYTLYLMDPNHGTNQTVTYGGAYYVNGTAHNWTSTLYKN